MPFTVTRPNGNGGRSYARIDDNGDLFWTPNKAKATPLAEGPAEIVVADLRRYSDDDFDIEGIAHAAAEQA